MKQLKKARATSSPAGDNPNQEVNTVINLKSANPYAIFTAIGAAIKDNKFACGADNKKFDPEALESTIGLMT